jgi:hypothetical protein
MRANYGAANRTLASLTFSGDRVRIIETLMLVALAAATAATSGAQTSAAAPGDIYAPLAMEEGTWDADVTFYEADKPASRATGIQINTLLKNRHWIINEFRIPATDTTPAYEGHGVWGYDPVAKTYVNTWVDTNDLAVRTDYGFWYEPESTMVWSSKQNDGNGHFVDYRITEEFKGNVRVLTFYQLGLAKPNPHPLVKIVFTRRKSIVVPLK